MKSRHARFRLAGAALHLLGACELGAPLVGVNHVADGGAERCSGLPECAPAAPSSSHAELDAAPVTEVDLSACHALDGCELEPADAAAGTCPATGGLEALQHLSEATSSCRRLRFEVHESPGEPLRLEGVSLRFVNLTLTSDVPLRVELPEPELHDVWLELVGPVQLHVFEPAAAEMLRVAGRRTDAGVPRLELERADATDLRVGDLDAPFDGEVSITRSECTGSQVVASDVRLESVSYGGDTLVAESLLALDTELAGVRLEVREAQLASCHLARTHVSGCASLTLLGTTATDTHFAACHPGILRAYDSQVFQCSIDGTVSAVDSGFNRVAFGVREATELRSWSGTVATSQFCAHARAHQISGSSATCNDCGGALLAEHAVCAPPNGAKPIAQLNLCEAWDSIAECPDPVERERPGIGGL